jgi:CRISPR-associated protein Cas2
MRYLITYDIADKRRLQKLQRHLQQCAIALQHSVYLFEGTPAQFAHCLNGIEQRIHAHHDDVRLYCIANLSHLRMEGRSAVPEGIWLSGDSQ